MSRREKGIEMFNEVYCGDLPHPAEEGQDKFFDFMINSLFGELWADDALSIKEKRLLLLGAIMAQGEDMTFALQCHSALKRGELTPEQLELAARFLTQYIGYPKGARLRMTLMGVIKEFEKSQE
ncbi:MAG: carboxymuconolactone decarboxylase family protein [Gammaproteobacteria bacterium]|nr:carboxymuconolactone decarboxylase family protein [Gammaproteobacteria bacterium]